MPDTIRAAFTGFMCSDCGVQEVIFKHWGPLVPSGTNGMFCGNCMKVRVGRSDSNQPTLPLGQTHYTERCAGKFTLLRFPDVDYLREPIPVSTKELGQRMTSELGFPVRYREGTICICEFFWKPDLDEAKVNAFLNELRRQYPQLIISENDHSCFPPHGC
jgi:hypothetical protein